jgi:hypothetical protein
VYALAELTFDRGKQRSTIYDRVERLDLKLQMIVSESSTVAVLTEKPSVARDIARVLGADKRGEGYLQGNGYVVTWAIGHLVSLHNRTKSILNGAWICCRSCPSSRH